MKNLDKFQESQESMNRMVNGEIVITSEDQNNLILRLNEETGRQILFCKKCLIRYNWNYEDALKYCHNTSIWKLIAEEHEPEIMKEITYDELMEGFE